MPIVSRDLAFEAKKITVPVRPEESITPINVEVEFHHHKISGRVVGQLTNMSAKTFTLDQATVVCRVLKSWDLQEYRVWKCVGDEKEIYSWNGIEGVWKEKRGDKPVQEPGAEEPTASETAPPATESEEIFFFLAPIIEPDGLVYFREDIRREDTERVMSWQIICEDGEPVQDPKDAHKQRVDDVPLDPQTLLEFPFWMTTCVCEAIVGEVMDPNPKRPRRR